jgi:DNA recombination protein RmuC
LNIPFEVEFILIIIAALLAGAVIVWLLMRSGAPRAFEAGKTELLPELERLSSLVEETEAAARRLKEEHIQLGKEFAVAEEKNRSIPELKSDRTALEGKIRELQKERTSITAELAKEKQRSENLDSLNRKLDQREKDIDTLRQTLSDQKSVESEIRTRMEEEKKSAEEKLALLDEARGKLTNQFRVLAQEILEEKSKTFSEQSETGLKSLLDPFRDQLSDFKQKVDTVYVHEAEQRATLKKEIETLRDLNQQISQEAINLTRALKGDKKAQGTWGELILERVLEQSGLRKGVEYETQGGFRDEDGKLLKPDVIVHLPEEKDVVVDSKVSLVAYERYASTEEDDERSKAMSEHVAAVRSHIEGLSGKDYATLKGLRSLDFVLMFMPIEAAFIAAFSEDSALYTYAFEKRIIVVTPSTLLATLKTIENIWRYEKQSNNAKAIFQRASLIYDKLRLFVESMEKLGKQMDTAQGTYEEAMTRLVRGKGNVISQVSKFSDLGVSVKKPLPKTITEIAELEGPAADEELLEEPPA